ncbi:hypothetical protein ABZS29_06180 [Kribbella sp. NPDC005582]|uniref:hypothetical protein n=1 Tax=Kribbella sp. NPDC005582 TaxID=3156893 RepID=UPI0033A5E995
MNLQDLRTELTARAEEAAERQPDLLPGVRTKIRRTKQRRTATALASVAAIAVLAVAVVPGVLNTSTPEPATPPDYVRNGQTVPGMINGDKLLKAWIGDPKQSKFSFSWTPTTNKIAIYAACDSVGYALPTEVRVTIGGRYLGSSVCHDGTTDSETVPLGTFLADSPLWLTAPVGKATTVSAEVVDIESGKAQTSSRPIRLGIYSTTDAARVGNPAPPAPGPDDFQQDGITYRKKIGGDTLLGAGVAGPGSSEVRFKFTSDGSLLKLRPFCTATNGPVNGNSPYMLQIRFNGKLATEMTCTSTSLDAGNSDTAAGNDRAPVGQVEVTARLIPTDKNSPPVPTDGYLALGVYTQGPKRVVGGVSLDERIEAGGVSYRLSTVKSAPGTAKQVEIDTPANQNFVLAYGGAGLGTAGTLRAEARVGTATAGGMQVESESHGDLGVSSETVVAQPATKAGMVLTEGKPTGGTLVIAIYLPV